MPIWREPPCGARNAQLSRLVCKVLCSPTSTGFPTICLFWHASSMPRIRRMSFGFPAPISTDQGSPLTAGATPVCHPGSCRGQQNVPQLSLHSPVGDLTIFEEDGAIVSLDWGWVARQTPTALLERAKQQIDAYMDGDLTAFELPLAPRGTPYRQAVWQALCEIPYGQTRSYGEIAARAGGSPRSVGQANGHNPIPIIIPCHRVVSGTDIGGYSGGEGLPTKRWLLALEGVQAWQLALTLI